MTPILLQPKGEKMRYSRQHNRHKLQEIGIDQGDVQQLLHILRGQLYITSFHKDIQKIDAAELWEDCDKKDKFTASTFAAYSQIYASYKQHKQEEKKLVSLITKLKGLK